MAVEENKRLAQEFFEALKKLFRGENVDISSFLAEDVGWNLPKSVTQAFGLPETTIGRGEAIKMTRGIGKVYVPESTKFEVHSWVAEDDWVAVRFSLQATTVNGKEYNNHYQGHLRCRDGVIAEIWETFDSAYLLSMFQ